MSVDIEMTEQQIDAQLEDAPLEGVSVEVTLSPLMTTPSGDYLVRCNGCDYTRPKSEPGPCPNGHTSGFTMVVEDEEQADEDGE